MNVVPHCVQEIPILPFLQFTPTVFPKPCVCMWGVNINVLFRVERLADTSTQHQISVDINQEMKFPWLRLRAALIVCINVTLLSCWRDVQLADLPEAFDQVYSTRHESPLVEQISGQILKQLFVPIAVILQLGQAMPLVRWVSCGT